MRFNRWDLHAGFAKLICIIYHVRNIKTAWNFRTSIRVKSVTLITLKLKWGNSFSSIFPFYSFNFIVLFFSWMFYDVILRFRNKSKNTEISSQFKCNLSTLGEVNFFQIKHWTLRNTIVVPVRKWGEINLNKPA